jgi:Taurine catabolism dioxygenase TauD, TfdA family
MHISQGINAPASGPAVWRGIDQQERNWIVPLDRDDCAEWIRVAEPLRGRALDQLNRGDFRVSRTAAKLAAVAWTLDRGSGFVMLRGLPAAQLSEDLLQIIYWGIGTHLGVGVSQSAAGDRLGHVYDRGMNDRERYYTRGGALEFHMDPVDAVGLLCLRTAKAGGASRIVSAGQVHNIIQAERPDLLELLYRGFHNSRRGHGEATPSDRVPVFAKGQHGIECYFLPATIRQATEEGFLLSPAEEEAIVLIEEVANRPGVFLDMDFCLGDIQFLSNRTILHSRTDYVDHPEPARKRHLLRLWLMMPDWAPRPATMNFHQRVDLAGGGVRPAHSLRQR